MKIVIAGYGVEGKASVAYWRALGAEVAVADEREELIDAPDGVPLILGRDAFERLDEYDMIVRSPSLRPDKLNYNGKVWSATNEFLEKCPAPVIGVTGTKGKGTTSSLITAILRAAGKSVHLVGNIGVPALEVLPNIQPTDIVVYELSSFQLWDAVRSPHVAAVLGIEPDHLDVHRDFDEYVSAKANIARHQQSSDILVYNANNASASHIATLSDAAEKIPYPFDISHVSSSLRIPGRHNIENASAAIAAVRTFTSDDEVIKQGLSAFTGLPHRLKFVAEKSGVRYYDDSIATTPGSAIAAMSSFGEPKILILGGSDKGAEYASVVEAAKDTGTRVIAIGQTGEKIAALCADADVPVTRETGLMPEVVVRAAALAAPGDVVILSPASASFDQYKSYSDRGDQFIRAVEELS